MAADGHAFSSSNTLDNLSRLLSTADDTALNWIVVTGQVTPGASPTVTTNNGIASVAQNATGDYTVTFANAFASAPLVFASAKETGGARFCTVYSESTTTARIRIYNSSGTLTDPDYLNVIAIGL